MNKQIEKLYKIAEKQERIILGLMSGTSLDGLDMAVCKIFNSGNDTTVTVTHYATVPFNDEFKKEVLEVFSREMVNLPLLTYLNARIGSLHAEIINTQLNVWNLSADEIDLIASHGQTIYHYPNTKKQNATLQIGDGDHIAVKTGIITLSDFRQKNIAAGGEGAPLAGYGDYLLFHEPGIDVVLLNMGGIANITHINGGGQILCSDVGPGNTIMDAFVRDNYEDLYFDEDGNLAATGNINDELLEELMKTEWLHQSMPKSTGPEIFNLELLDVAMNNVGVRGISNEDVLATLNEFTAINILNSIRSCDINSKCKIYPSGGGIHNKYLMDKLQQALPQAEFCSTATKGINPDAKEAVLFALLANECVAGNAQTFKNTGSLFQTTMGKISLP